MGFTVVVKLAGGTWGNLDGAFAGVVAFRQVISRERASTNSEATHQQQQQLYLILLMQVYLLP